MRKRKSQQIIEQENALEVVASRWGLSLIDYFEERSEAFNLDEYARSDAEFAQWLDESVLHRVEVLRFINAWNKADNFSELKSPFFSEPSNSKSKMVGKTGFGFGIAASFLLVSVLTVKLIFDTPAITSAPDVFVQAAPASLEYVYQTQVGSFEDVRLPDGTLIEVNSDSHLEVQLSENKRRVTLIRGEAFFDVAKDENRPFEVYAGNRVVTVIGTRFSVHHQDRNFEVAVEEGVVKLGPNKPSNDSRETTILRAGDVVLANPYSSDETLKVAEADIDFVAKELSWRKGYVVFDGHTVSQAIDEFNRYNITKMVYHGASSNEIKISGRFSSQNVDGFTRLLSDGFGYQIRHDSKKVIISQKP